MGAIILDDAIVNSNVIVGAGSVVTQGMILESGFIYAGVPAKKIKAIDPEKQEFYVNRTAEAYVKYAKYYDNL
jgi:carbonic anhydrase/acetyltransferase-like protein (isoleucine patch superfamily)